MPKNQAGPIATPATLVARPPKNKKGGPGKYDGEPGLPGRTASKEGAPEKVRDDCDSKY